MPPKKPRTEIITQKDAPLPAPAVQAPDPFMALVEKVIANPDLPVENLRALLEMKSAQYRHNAEIVFNHAMREAQIEMEPVKRDAENSHTKSKYATLERLDAALRPVYVAHGFSLSFNSEQVNQNTVRVTCDVAHSGGFTKKFELTGELDGSGAKGGSNKTAIQALGSTVSYLRRYLTLMIFNVVMRGDDNDGNRPQKSITEDQIMQLDVLLKETHSNEARFFEFMGVKGLADIFAKDFRKALNALETKKQKEAKQ